MKLLSLLTLNQASGVRIAVGESFANPLSFCERCKFRAEGCLFYICQKVSGIEGKHVASPLTQLRVRVSSQSALSVRHRANTRTVYGKKGTSRENFLSRHSSKIMTINHDVTDSVRRSQYRFVVGVTDGGVGSSPRENPNRFC